MSLFLDCRKVALLWPVIWLLLSLSQLSCGPGLVNFVGASGTAGSSSSGGGSGSGSSGGGGSSSPTQLAFATQPSSQGGASLAFPTQPVVVAQDSNSATVSSYAGAVSLSAYTDSTCATAAGGTLSVTANPATAASGLANFAGVAYGSVGTLYLKASASGLKSACSQAVLLGATTESPTDCPTSAANTFGYVDVGSGSPNYAQVGYTATTHQFLTFVILQIGSVFGVGSGTVSVEVATDNAGNPGTILGTASVAGNTLTSTGNNGPATFNFSPGIFLTSGQTYHFVLDGTAAGSMRVAWSNATSATYCSSTNVTEYYTSNTFGSGYTIGGAVSQVGMIAIN